MVFGIMIPVSGVSPSFERFLTLLEFIRLVINLRKDLNLIMYLPKSEIFVISRSLAWALGCYLLMLWVALTGFNFEQDDPGNNFSHFGF